MTTPAEVLTGLSEATTLIGALVPGAGLVTSWLGPLLSKGAEMARAGLTPQHVTRIDVAALKRLVADADSSLDARAEAHDAPPSTEPAPSVYPEDGT